MKEGNAEMDNEETRVRWIKQQLSKLNPGLTILDAGAGQLRYKDSCSHLHYISQDFGEFKGNKDGEGLITTKWDTSTVDIISDIIDIPMHNESVDAILCTEVLEHCPHPELVIKELSRILKNGGVLILTAPFNSLTHFAPYHYCTGFNKYWYEEILPMYGLEIVELTANGNYFLYLQQEINRVNGLIRKYQTGVPRLVKWGGRLICMGMKKQLSNNEASDIGCFGYMVVAHKA